MRAKYFAIVSALLSTVVASTPRPRLVPRKRELTLDRRSLRSLRQDIIPKDTVVLNYATTPYHPPSATVSLTAQEGRPILLIEEFDHLLESVSCSSTHARALGDVVSMAFSDDSTYRSALEEWKFLHDFAVITTHPGCNLDEERGAWIVSSMLEDALDKRLTFLVEPVAMRDIVKSFGITYNHNGANTWQNRQVKSLSRRIDFSSDSDKPYSYNGDLDSRQSLFPPNSSLDSSVPEDILSKLTDAELDLTCIDCKFDTNVTIGMDFGIDLGGMNTSFTLNNASMNLTIEQFEQDIALEIFIGKEVKANTKYKIAPPSLNHALLIPDLVDIGPDIGLEIVFDLDITSSINLTLGATGHIPSGAFVSVSLLNSDGGWDPTTLVSGWDNSSLVQVPLLVNDGQFNISASVALVPYVDFNLTILGVGAALRITENMPKASVNASLQTLVNRECEPIGDVDFESFGTAFVVSAGLTLSTEIELLIEKGNLPISGIPDNYARSLWSREIPFAPALGLNETSCFVLSSGDLTVNITNSEDRVDAELAGLPAATGTLFAAASAIPTWDMTKIESYYSAHNALPTNVNYTQMIAATTIPTNLQSAVTGAVVSQTSTSTSGSSTVAPALSKGCQWLIWACLSGMATAFTLG